MAPNDDCCLKTFTVSLWSGQSDGTSVRLLTDVRRRGIVTGCAVAVRTDAPKVEL